MRWALFILSDGFPDPFPVRLDPIADGDRGRVYQPSVNVIGKIDGAELWRHSGSQLVKISGLVVKTLMKRVVIIRLGMHLVGNRLPLLVKVLPDNLDGAREPIASHSFVGVLAVLLMERVPTFCQQAVEG